MLAESAPGKFLCINAGEDGSQNRTPAADAIYSMRVENTAVHITPDNKMKVVIYPRVGATGDTAKQKNKNKAGPPPLTGTPMPRRPETQIPAHLLDDLYSNAHPTVMGVPLDGDFTKLPKPQNQLPVEQFWRHAEQFWRPLTEEDFAWLQSPGEQVQVYALPSLGRPYAQQWDDEDRVLAGNDPLTARSVETSEFRFENDIIVPGDAMLGPFTERTLQALVQEDLLDTTSVVSQTSDAETLVQQPIPEYLPRTKQDLADLEERIRVELQYIDLAPPSDLPGGDSQDDEVTRELRRAQHQIKSQIERNTRIKARIHEVALKWLAYQEYVGVKEELDRQIDAAYVRRFVGSSICHTAGFR